jgi:hypothetical protein
MVFYVLKIDGENRHGFDTLCQLIEELENVVTCENLKTTKVKRYEKELNPETYYFCDDGSYLVLKNDKKRIATPAIKQKLDAESKKINSPLESHKYFLCKNDLPLCNFDTIDQLIKELEGVVTCENIKTISVVVCEESGGIRFSLCYRFTYDGACLFMTDHIEKTIPTPTVKLKLEAESKNNSPQNVQPIKTNEKPQTPNYLLIKDNEPNEKSFDDLRKELSKMSLGEIQKITIYSLTDKVIFKYSPEKMLFESKDSTIQLSYYLTEHLICTYKMLIVSAEDPNDPFKLTKKYMCEKKVLIKGSEFEEMQEYRRVQEHRTDQIAGEFKFDGLFKGHLVRIFLVKNNIIIGEINDRGIFYKSLFKLRLNAGEYEKCQKAIESYINYVTEFRKKPLEEIKKIYTEMRIHDGSSLHDGPSLNAFKMPYNVDVMVNLMIKANEFNMMLQ